MSEGHGRLIIGKDGARWEGPPGTLDYEDGGVRIVSHHDGEYSSGAHFSLCGTYRYRLWRDWPGGSGYATFVMLNPSTADAQHDDPTVRRCIGFAKRWGMAGLSVVNLYALRATDPRELWRASDPVGPLNDDAIIGAMRNASRVVAAWGVHAKRERVDAMLAARRREHEIDEACDLRDGLETYPLDPLLCLGTSKSGAPRHPLYVSGGTELGPWGNP